jgi:hypothetical protein
MVLSRGAWTQRVASAIIASLRKTDAEAFLPIQTNALGTLEFLRGVVAKTLIRGALERHLRGTQTSVS